ncbi:MAG: hypothetical protein ABFS42_11440 [Candidatus Krumholzibacteriota bacterium]
MPETPTRRVMQATWNWQSREDAVPGGPAGQLRRGALIQAVVMGLIAAFLFFGLHHHLLARVIWALAGLVLILGLVFPPAYRPIHTFGRWLGSVVGQGLTYLLLVPFFFLFFTPVSLILRLQGRDPLHRGFRDPQWTYWIARSQKSREENIDRQFLREEREGRKQLRPVGEAAGGQGTDRP